MSKRLQIVIADDDLRRYQRTAQSEGLTVSEWVRQALRAAEREASVGDAGKKLARLRQAVNYNFPAPNIDQMVAEIEGGYTPPSGPE